MAESVESTTYRDGDGLGLLFVVLQVDEVDGVVWCSVVALGRRQPLLLHRFLLCQQTAARLATQIVLTVAIDSCQPVDERLK